MGGASRASVETRMRCGAGDPENVPNMKYWEYCHYYA